MFLWLIIPAAVIWILVYLSRLLSPRKMDLNGAHVLVTGGSSGIGKALAIYVVKNGANVTIVARNLQKLQEAKEEIEQKATHKQRVVCISEDITKDAERAVRKAEEELGPVDVLINNAGTSICGVFEELDKSEFENMMHINYFGGVYITRAIVKTMKARNKGRIVFVSSQAGQIGLFGYTAYSASKFALRGLGEALQMEGMDIYHVPLCSVSTPVKHTCLTDLNKSFRLTSGGELVKPYNIYVTLAFPPDTDTPGFALEQETKCKETALISETAGLFSAGDVASRIVEDSLNGKFLCHMGMDGYLLANGTCGMAPVTSLLEIIQQVLTMGLFRFISWFYLMHFDSIVNKCKLEKESAKLKTS